MIRHIQTATIRNSTLWAARALPQAISRGYADVTGGNKQTPKSNVDPKKYDIPRTDEQASGNRIHTDTEQRYRDYRESGGSIPLYDQKMSSSSRMYVYLGLIAGTAGILWYNKRRKGIQFDVKELEAQEKKRLRELTTDRELKKMDYDADSNTGEMGKLSRKLEPQLPDKKRS